MSEKQSVAMTEHEVARRLRISAATLRAWRARRKGPRYVRFGRAVRYLQADIERFIQTSLVDDGGATDRDACATRGERIQ